MSFSHDIKSEILESRQARARHKRAQAYGLYLFGRRFDAQEMVLSTENRDIAQLYAWYAADMLGAGMRAVMSERKAAGKTLYTVTVAEREDRVRILDAFAHTDGVNLSLAVTLDDAGAFLAGAFLACGNMTDPEKRYHLEFVARREKSCAGLAQLLENFIPGVKTTTRRGLYVVYYKECVPIEDLLTLMGASRASLAVIDVEMIKEVRNRANRVTNCETANIDKLVSAASSQVADICFIVETKGWNHIPEELREAATLRLENPELSLRELALLMDEPCSRSGMHRKLEKISKLAAGLRGDAAG
ncbi:MAG: DNA-binding protein WhiA [Oscillospiraceae bacterium]|jgi:DNA-binding protein WhiA|nr:DNA-binding protein WhiA [Oscillospiraceae bacterium]